MLIGITLFAPPTLAEVNYFISGNHENVDLKLQGSAYNLGGGGPDIDSAIEWMINQVRGCENCNQKVDVVVIRDSGDDGYNEAILKMNGVDSVETVVISNRQDANDPQAITAIENAEVIFFAGGDQCNYIRNFRNTNVEKAVKSVIDRGGAVGGTSAGSMIQSDFVFNACSNTVTSEDALSNPYEDIDLNRDFFNWKNLENTIIDTHFYERDSMGRLMTFVARLIRDGVSDWVLGIGVDEETSVIIDKQGFAEVIGEGYADFVLGDHQPEKCEPQTPLTFSDYQVWKIGNGESFNLKNYPTTGYQGVSIEDGELLSDPY
ncbi:MAG: Type 1 glutamine amidotransferase-like domain-containing protein [Lyngbya sp.]|nr:Type 1 glutamine amidotransferase-like domain-containing protein [Lyngbya sp.]